MCFEGKVKNFNFERLGASVSIRRHPQTFVAIWPKPSRIPVMHATWPLHTAAWQSLVAAEA